MSMIKDPDALLDFKFDWTAWLAAGETITAATVTVPAGLTVGTGAQATSHDTTSATVWLSGGTAGVDYDVVCHVTTSAGRQDDRTLTIMVRQR